MSKNRMLNTRFWSDGWVADMLNPHDRYLLLYLMLNERTTISGVYEVPLRTVANETGIERDEVGRMITRLEPKVFYRDGWVVLVNSIKHQNYKSPKIQAAIARELCNAPADLVELLHLPQDLELDMACPVDTKRYGSDTVSISQHIPNLTKPNLTKPNAAKPRAAKKPLKSQYAKSVAMDDALSQKEQAARERKGGGTKSGYQLAKERAEQIKQKRLSK